MGMISTLGRHHLELYEYRLLCLNLGHSIEPWRARAAADAVSLRTRRRYGTRAVCRAWAISSSTLYRRLRKASVLKSDATSAYVPTDDEVAEKLRQIIAEYPFPAERHRKLWARLNRSGMRVGRDRVRRIIRDRGLGLPLFGSLIPNHPNRLWGIDSISVPTGQDGLVRVLFVVDHFHLRWLSSSVVKEESLAGWWSVLRDAVADASPGVPVSPRVKVCLDNLGLFREKEFRSMLLGLRLVPHHISLGRPQSNGIAERFVRVIKENLLFWSRWDTLQNTATAIERFRVEYNRAYLIERLGMRSPDEVEGARPVEPVLTA